MSDCNTHHRSTGRRDISVGLSVTCIVDYIRLKVRVSMVDQTVVEIHRLVCPSQSSKIEQASKFIGRSVRHRHDRSNGRQISSIGLSVTSIVHRTGVEIRWWVCPS
jgi:hypothetical protein